jgi:hypothetical protein
LIIRWKPGRFLRKSAPDNTVRPLNHPASHFNPFTPKQNASSVALVIRSGCEVVKKAFRGSVTFLQLIALTDASTKSLEGPVQIRSQEKNDVTHPQIPHLHPQ